MIHDSVPRTEAYKRNPTLLEAARLNPQPWSAKATEHNTFYYFKPEGTFTFRKLATHVQPLQVNRKVFVDV
jgi:hypothetical protein